MSEHKTACGGTIVIPRKAEDHLRAHPEVLEILPEVIGKVSLPQDGSFLAEAVEMGRCVGVSGRVSTPAIGLDEPATFAQRVGRTRPSRVIVGVEGPEVSTVVVLAFPSREEKGTYVLVTSWVGDLAPKEPWDATPGEFQEALAFWSSNALVWDSAVMSEPFESTWAEVLGL